MYTITVDGRDSWQGFIVLGGMIPAKGRKHLPQTEKWGFQFSLKLVICIVFVMHTCTWGEGCVECMCLYEGTPFLSFAEISWGRHPSGSYTTVSTVILQSERLHAVRTCRNFFQSAIITVWTQWLSHNYPQILPLTYVGELHVLTRDNDQLIQYLRPSYQIKKPQCASTYCDCTCGADSACGFLCVSSAQ